MTVVTNMHKTCHDYEGVMLVLCTPLQVKSYQNSYELKMHKH